MASHLEDHLWPTEYQRLSHQNTLATSGAIPGKKRKSDGLASDHVDALSFGGGVPIGKTPDKVRRQIRTFLDNGGMKVGDFCKEIGVSNSSLNLFLSQSGNKGSGSNTFFGASRFFTHREVVGLPMPSKAKKQKTSDTGSHQSATTGAATGVDPSLIEIPGQYTGDVAVYDTCDEIRRKMNAHLKREDVTKAQFARDLQALLPAHITTKVQGGQIDAFRNKKGPKAGCTSSVYATAYVFFEKQRIAENKPKSKHRKDMEEIWPGGMERDRDGKALWVTSSKTPYEDKYGRISIH